MDLMATPTRRLPTAPRPSGSTRKTPKAYYNRGVAYGDKGDYDKAIADCTEAIRLNPKIATAYCNRGFAYWRRATTTRRSPTAPRPSGSTRNCRRRTTTVALPTREGRLRQGDCRLHRGHPAGSEVCLGISQPGRAYAKKGDYDKAIADYTEAIRLDPKNAEAYCNRGHAYEEKGDYDKAIADCTEAIRLDPKVPGRITTEAVPKEKGRLRQSHR